MKSLKSRRVDFFVFRAFSFFHLCLGGELEGHADLVAALVEVLAVDQGGEGEGHA